MRNFMMDGVARTEAAGGKRRISLRTCAPVKRGFAKDAAKESGAGSESAEQGDPTKLKMIVLNFEL